VEAIRFLIDYLFELMCYFGFWFWGLQMI